MMIRAAAILALFAALMPGRARAEDRLTGTVLDAETKKPIAYVTITLDAHVQHFSLADGSFDFGIVEEGEHTLIFDHISYHALTLDFDWPAEEAPLVVTLEPSEFATREIVVTGERTVRSLPVSAIPITRRDALTTAGNIANDPLRTLQSQPSCAAEENEFFPKMAVRGGDTEEHRVYFDGYPLVHYAHVGGFAGVIYDDMLDKTVLIPGAAPVAYTGSLSGVVLLTPAKSDTTFRSFRYDITSMAGGIGQVVNPSLSFQLSAKTDFFNLPVYQQPNVKERAFKDALGRVTWSPRESLTATATLLGAMDSEIGIAAGVEQEREVRSALAGIRVDYRRAGYELSVRPSYSFFDSRDALTWDRRELAHELREARLRAGITRQFSSLALGLSGEIGEIRHSGTGGEWTDHPSAAAAELEVLLGDAAALVLGGGGSNEPWSSGFDPEAYASARWSPVQAATISGGYRRSHQSPFVFSERRYFASLPIDPGELLAAYGPSWEDAPAVRMDQISAEASVTLPFRSSITLSGFERQYRNLLTWEWDGLPDVRNVRSEGDGRGYGYEIVLQRDDPDFIHVTAAFGRANVWKREGSLLSERIGDFDRPHSWQVAVSLKVSDQTRVTLHWMDVSGRPYTSYPGESAPPSTGEVNAVRLPRFQRLDAKIVFSFSGTGYAGEAFVDIVNCLNFENIAAMYAVEVGPGEFQSAGYWGTLFFPIGGVTVRF
jgi:hypothetical protein